jgi:uncharacterized protein
MNDHPSERRVVNDESDHRFVIRDPLGEAFIQYRLRTDRLILIHTEVPAALEGRGLAAELVLAAVDHAAAHDLTVVPLCPMARSWLMRHPDVAQRVTIDWAQDVS